MRAAKDPVYQNILTEVCQRNVSESTYQLLLSRVCDLDSLPPNIPIITPRRLPNYHFNETLAFKAAQNSTLFIFVASYFYQKKLVTDPQFLAQLKADKIPPTRKSLYHKISVAPDSPVVLLENLSNYKKYGYNNGTTGTIVAVSSKHPPHLASNMKIYLHEVTVYFLPHKLNSDMKQIFVPGMAPGVIPIKYSTSTRKVFLPGFSVTVNMHQLPLTGAYAITCYKSQGRTFESAIVDLSYYQCPTASPYVMLSRIKSLNGLYILKHFKKNALNRPLSLPLKEAIARLTNLSMRTLSEENI